MPKRKILSYPQSVGARVEIEQYCKEKNFKEIRTTNLKDFLEKIPSESVEEIIVDYFFVNEIHQREAYTKFFELATESVANGVKLKLMNPCTPLESKEIRPEYSRWVKRNFTRETIYGLFERKETPA